MAHKRRATYVLTKMGYKTKSLIRLSSKLPGANFLMKMVLNDRTLMISSIPIYENIEMTPDVVPPLTLLEHFIDESPDRVIIHKCMCRRENHCRDYDPQMGCLFLGAGAKEIDESVGRHVDRADAMEHVRKAVASGLVPKMGKILVDALVLGVKDHNHLMTVCFCCPCCCIGKEFAYVPKESRAGIVRLKGLTVEVTGDCSACGKCAEICPLKLISIVDKRALISEECKGCGRCAEVCPSGAITVKLEDPTFFEEADERLGSMVRD